MEYVKRKNIRLEGYDYSSSGGYYITICTHDRLCILSRVCTGDELHRATVELTSLGEIADQVLHELAGKYGIQIAAYVIMPNHIHMIMLMKSPEITVGRFVGAFKSLVSNRWQKVCEEGGRRMGKLWQRNYYDHILRNEKDFLEKMKYIDENPDKWAMDELYIR